MSSRYRPLIPVLLLVICCLSTLFFWLKGTITEEGAPAKYVLNLKHLGAFAATIATVASFLVARPYCKYFFVLTFLFGILGIINFTISESSVGVAFGPLQIGLSPLLALVGLVAYLVCSSRIKAKILALLQPSEEKVARARLEELATYKERFARKSTEELAQIVAANALVPSALAAARDLLKERP